MPVGRPKKSVKYHWCDVCKASVSIPCLACLARKARKIDFREAEEDDPGRARCRRCGTVFSIVSSSHRVTRDGCPACGSRDKELAQRPKSPGPALLGDDKGRHRAIIAQRLRGCPTCGNGHIVLQEDGRGPAISWKWRCQRCGHDWPARETNGVEDERLLAEAETE